MAALVESRKRPLGEDQPPPAKRAKDGREDQLRHITSEFVEVPENCRSADQTRAFSEGAILSMRLVNFQVATDSTYRFGPYLNLVLGSNGTGKSTIVNAIFLLFRGKLADLDRTNYDEFIQFGKPYAVVSALLQGKAGKSNPVIALKIMPRQRHRGADNGGPQWYVNGRGINEDDADRFVNTMRIQVNNLCQFLPQFRVAAFSSESPQQRLVSTEHAIGYRGMREDHQVLAQTGTQLAELKKEVEVLTARTRSLTEKRDSLRAKKEQLELANQDKKKADMLERVLKLARYEEAGNKLTELRAQLEESKQKIREFDEESSEKREIIQQEDLRAESLRDARDELAQQLRSHERSLRECESKIRAHRENASDNVKRINNLQSDMSTAGSRISKYTQEEQDVMFQIGTLRKQLNDLGSDTAMFQEQQRQCSHLESKHAKLAARQQSLHLERAQLSKRVGLHQESIRRGQNTLSQLEQSSQLESRSPYSLGNNRYDRDAFARSVEFVNRHQDKFEKPVIMPAILSLYVTDAGILPVFAEVVSFVHLQKFICQTKNDQERLTELASEAHDLDIKTTFVASSGSATQGFDDRTVASLKDLGFDGFLSDKLDGPEPVLRFMNSLGVNRIPISATELSSRVREKLRGSSQRSLEFADKSAIYRIQRSKYGRHLPTETSRPLAASIPQWARLMVRKDTSAEQAAQKKTIENLTNDVSVMQTKLGDLEKEIIAIEHEMKTVTSDIKAMKSKISEEARLRDGLSKATARRTSLLAKLSEIKALQAQRSTQLVHLVERLKSELEAISKRTLELSPSLMKEAQSGEYILARKSTEVDDVETQIGFLKRALHKQRRELEQVVADKQKSVSEAENKQRDLHHSYEGATAWLRSNGMLEVGTEKAKSTSIEDLKDELDRMSATVDLHNQRSESLPSVLQQLEYAEGQLADDERQLQLSTKSLEDITTNTSDIRERWEGALNSMIERTSAKFSELFGKLGCRGSVTLDSGNNLEIGEWGININVAFRAEERGLSKLSKFRQSGGERAVSTAMYLLALQEMATAPFRVLDEINQGMDERNEHTTMKFFVDLTCRPASGKAQQSFLVTPKLISNMPYHRNMNVTYIFGGIAVGDTAKMKSSAQFDRTIELLKEEIDSENDDESD